MKNYSYGARKRAAHQSAYTINDVASIAERAKVDRGVVLRLIEGREKTEDRELAGMVSALTGEIPKTYLSAGGVIIHTPTNEEGSYSLTRAPEETEIKDLDDLDLLQLCREVDVLRAQIRMEMTQRVYHKRAPSEKRNSLDDVIRGAVMQALRQTGGNRRLAAEQLGITRPTLRKHVRAYFGEADGV